MTEPRQVIPLPKEKAKKGRRSPSAATLKRRATSLHSQYVRARDGRCVRCGRNDGRLECMHVFSRRYAATRTAEMNGHTGCSGCHMFLTQNPLEHVNFFRALLTDEVFFRLRDDAYAGSGRSFPASFWQAECDRLSEKLGRLS